MDFYKRKLKRIIDVAISSAGLLFLLPFLFVIALIIKREDGGSILYHGLRVGKDGTSFRIYKFRTMIMDADKIGGPSASNDDTRITRVGAMLRKYKLDELPQLINVLKGEMSLIGPRPEVPPEVATYSDEERRVLSVKPGITDWASIEFRNEGEILRGAEDPHQAYRERIRPEKIRLALKYVDEISLKTDLVIMWKTIKAVLFE